MKTVFQAFARYNKNVNEDMLKFFVEPLSREQVFRDLKTYHKSVFAVVKHILLADLNWIRRFRDKFPGSPALEVSAQAKMDNEAVKKELDADYTKLYGYRKELDETILQFINGLGEDEFNAVVEYKDIKGNTVKYELWKLLMQMFNHEAHHRGQAAIMIDMLGVFNDFSALLPKI